VSILAITLGDHRLIAAHEEAARIAMTRLEAEACARVRKGRQDSERRTGEVVGATVTHGTSRALDPQLHTH
jgi:conjugative relaxase-like TrwC/TraI family protein